jgi:glutathione S-transferase
VSLFVGDPSTLPLRVLGKATSINVRKVLWTCVELKLNFVREDWGTGFSSTDAPSFLALNPNGLVPVIVDEEGALWESNTICRYLTHKAGRHDLLPASGRARALVEQWMDWQATELNYSWRDAFMGLVRRHPDFQDAERIRASTRKWNGLMGLLDEQVSRTGAFVAGAEFSLADVPMGLSLNRWRLTLSERPHFPGLDAYADRLSQRQGYLEHCANGIP